MRQGKERGWTKKGPAVGRRTQWGRVRGRGEETRGEVVGTCDAEEESGVDAGGGGGRGCEGWMLGYGDFTERGVIRSVGL